jgi:hypothetical protein
MKPLQAPEVALRPDAVSQQKTEVAERTAKPAPAIGPADIHKNAIDVFVQFLKGEVHSATVEERSNYQVEFIQNLEVMFGVKSSVVNEVCDYLVECIYKNPSAFSGSILLAPLYQVEKDRMLSIVEIERYKVIMIFFVMLTNNLQNRARFLANYDVRKMLSAWPPTVAKNLNNYIYR